MEKLTRRATRITILINIFLFVIKLFAGVSAHSLAIISDAFNSFTDILASIAILIAVKVSYQKPDWNHPFGHSRAQPVAGLIVAVLACVLGIEIAQTAVYNLVAMSHDHPFSWPPVLVLLVTILTKVILSSYLHKIGRQAESPAIRASAIDSRNDVLISTVALLGYLISSFGFLEFDDLSAILISGFIMYSGYEIGKENLDYLMGCAPSLEVVKRIKYTTLNVDGVIGFHKIRAHYVGNYVHVEVHIDVDNDLTITEAHAIGTNVQQELEKVEIIAHAFVHIDPISVTLAGED